MTPTARAQKLVNGDRQQSYGHPLPNHERIAAFWNVRLNEKLREGEVIEPHEVAAMMRLVKEARLMETVGHPDSLDDSAGYADVEYLIHEGYETRPVSRLARMFRFRNARGEV